MYIFTNYIYKIKLVLPLDFLEKILTHLLLPKECVNFAKTHNVLCYF